MSPSRPLTPPPEDPRPTESADIANLTEEDCRQALLNFASKDCCSSSKPAREMTIIHHSGHTAYCCSLETFTEDRITKIKRVPYKGGPVNGSSTQSIDINCRENSMSKNHTITIEVPQSAKIQSCQDCLSRGYFNCPECGGGGTKMCIFCAGTGYMKASDFLVGRTYEDICGWCRGNKTGRCEICLGTGRKICTECEGNKEIKTFTEMTFEFKNHVSRYVIDCSNMPRHLLKKVNGNIEIQQVQNPVYPISSYPVQEVNTISTRIVNEHKEAFPNGNILKQRQQLQAVPVTEVHYIWENEQACFWIYGLEQEVYAPDYPKQGCWGCIIL